MKNFFGHQSWKLCWISGQYAKSHNQQICGRMSFTIHCLHSHLNLGKISDEYGLHQWILVIEDIKSAFQVKQDTDDNCSKRPARPTSMRVNISLSNVINQCLSSIQWGHSYSFTWETFYWLNFFFNVILREFDVIKYLLSLISKSLLSNVTINMASSVTMLLTFKCIRHQIKCDILTKFWLRIWIQRQRVISFSNQQKSYFLFFKVISSWFLRNEVMQFE